MSQPDLFNQPSTEEELRRLYMNVGASQKEMRAYFRVGYKAWHRWIDRFKDELGEINGMKYTPAQVKVIFRRLCED